MTELSFYEFRECETCDAKPGSPALCAGCLHNRTAISAMQRELLAARRPVTTLVLKLAKSATCRMSGLVLKLQRRQCKW